MEDKNGIVPVPQKGGAISVTELKAKLPVVPVDLPFSHEIFLFRTSVAGTSYVENIEEIGAKLQEKDELAFMREPDNKYDKKAIMVKTLNGDKIGYVPRADNIVFSRLMDAGKLLYARVKTITKRGTWYEIDIDIYLKD